MTIEPRHREPERAEVFRPAAQEERLRAGAAFLAAHRPHDAEACGVEGRSVARARILGAAEVTRLMLWTWREVRASSRRLLRG